MSKQVSYHGCLVKLGEQGKLMNSLLLQISLSVKDKYHDFSLITFFCGFQCRRVICRVKLQKDKLMNIFADLTQCQHEFCVMAALRNYASKAS